MSTQARIRVPNELFAPAESSSFAGELEIGVLAAGPDLYDFAAPVRWQADLTNTGGAILLTGTVEGTARTSCARCLEPVEMELFGEIEGYYLIDPEECDPEDREQDEFDVLPEDSVIDLEGPIKAALLLELPLVPLCDDECKGICPDCGANLNEGDCGCADARAAREEAEEQARNPFAALKGLTFDEQ